MLFSPLCTLILLLGPKTLCQNQNGEGRFLPEGPRMMGWRNTYLNSDFRNMNLTGKQDRGEAKKTGRFPPLLRLHMCKRCCEFSSAQECSSQSDIAKRQEYHLRVSPLYHYSSKSKLNTILGFLLLSASFDF